MPVPNPDYADLVLEVAARIPSGCVLAYGDIAEIIGYGGPRQVGSVMSHYGSDVPWWRIVRADGRPAQGLEREARAHHLEEGTPLVGGQLSGSRVDLRLARWLPTDSDLAGLELAAE